MVGSVCVFVYCVRLFVRVGCYKNFRNDDYFGLRGRAVVRFNCVSVGSVFSFFVRLGVDGVFIF